MKYILKITKYSFIIFTLLAIIFFIIFYTYSKRLNYSIPKTFKAEFIDTNGEVFLTINNTKKNSYVTIDEISPFLINAFISIEDKNFYNHKGINPIRIIGAMINNIKNGKIVEGASTITQQYARNLYLNSNKNFKRKIDEIMKQTYFQEKYFKTEICIE